MSKQKRTITLVCSGHRVNGLCNVEELLKILRALQPEVVFLEIRPSDHPTLEAQAMARYLVEFKSCQPVHVDRYDISANLTKEDVDRVLDCVWETSEEYGQLERENAIGVIQNGFRYLNSSACAAWFERKHAIEDETILATGDQGLIEGLEKWRQVMRTREIEMVGNIYEFCREKAFDTGVFLVGAAHKTGIVKEIEKQTRTEVDLICWNFIHDGPNLGLVRG